MDHMWGMTLPGDRPDSLNIQNIDLEFGGVVHSAMKQIVM